MSGFRIWALAWALGVAPGWRVRAVEGTPPVAFSPDRKAIVYVRATPTILVETALGQAEATELWLAKPDGRDARMLLRGHTAPTAEGSLARFSDAQFSLDGRRIYFLSAAWVTSGAVHVLDLGSGAEKYLCSGNSLEVVPRGAYAGYLMVQQHRYAMGGGSYDWLWLIAPEGKSGGLISMDDPAATEVFRRIYFKDDVPKSKRSAPPPPENEGATRRTP